MRQLPQQQARQDSPERRDGVGIMALGAGVAIRAGGSPAAAWGQ